jgi:hypothetical protein
VGETKADTKEYFSIDFISHSMSDASSSNYDSTTPPIGIDYEDGKENEREASGSEGIKLLDKEAEMKGEAKSSTDTSESHESNSPIV